MKDFLMPSLGADMDHGKVVEWVVGPGDEVKRGDIVVHVETEKGIIEVEIWEDGIFGEILVGVGEDVPVGTPIGRFMPAGAVAEQVAAPEPAAVPVQASEPAVVAATGQPEPVPGGVVSLPPPVRHLAHQLDVDLNGLAGSGPDGAITRADILAAAARSGLPAPLGPPEERLRASPLARRLAGQLGIDLATVTGTGPGGAITEADVVHISSRGEEATPVAQPRPAATTEPAAPPAAGAEQGADEAARRQAAMRHAIAQLMSRSKREIPHYYLGTRIDMSRAMSWLEEENARRSVNDRLLPAVMLLKAAALAVRDVPEMNGFWVEDHFEQSDAVHLGVAISLRRGGLIAPALHDADAKSLDEIMGTLRDLVQRTRTGRLRSSEMSDPTITITNLGDRGVEEVYGVIYHPQVALVGFGKVVERPWASGGMLGVRPVMAATLAADHRVSDGHRGGLYLAAIERLLQKPEEL